MTLTIGIIAISLLLANIVYRQCLEKKKYQDSTYLKNLKHVASFFDTIQALDDYVTWVHRDQIKSTYSTVGKYFKNKTNFYKKEKNVKLFNEVFNNFDNYIAQYNQDYIRVQKEKLDKYFDDVEGKKLDNQHTSPQPGTTTILMKQLEILCSTFYHLKLLSVLILHN